MIWTSRIGFKLVRVGAGIVANVIHEEMDNSPSWHGNWSLCVVGQISIVS
jgi:hypothetical protein